LRTKNLTKKIHFKKQIKKHKFCVFERLNPSPSNGKRLEENKGSFWNFPSFFSSSKNSPVSTSLSPAAGKPNTGVTNYANNTNMQNPSPNTPFTPSFSPHSSPTSPYRSEGIESNSSNIFCFLTTFLTKKKRC
jgi:hypothetical protein